jgi:tetraacyldisaccharide-1-P 4'-kinase
VQWRARDALERLVERLWYGRRGLLFALLFLPLWPLSLVARLASRRRRRRPGPKGPLPTIGVGNLVAGGSGKTQVVLALGRRPLADGARAALVTRGYGGALVAAESPFGNGHLLPLGPLRDPPAAIARDDLVWLHGEGGAPAGLRVGVHSRSRPAGLVSAFDLRGAPTGARGVAVAAFCGIARPARFFASLEEAGVRLLARWGRGDHRVFTASELLRGARTAQALGASALVCTEKDAVRLPAVALPLPVFALRVELEILSGEAAIDALLAMG